MVATTAEAQVPPDLIFPGIGEAKDVSAFQNALTISTGIDARMTAKWKN
ncbi:MAG: hypothetical protein JKY10_01775 [Cohaesibacteraceae bacterium]|nr:hypothetical protein [Cohaesibacteraceae bacterium]